MLSAHSRRALTLACVITASAYAIQASTSNRVSSPGLSEGRASPQARTIRAGKAPAYDAPVAKHDWRAPRLIQPGSGLSLLGVTSDGHGIYQDGLDIYATRLSPGATRVLIGRSPAGSGPIVLIRGRVAFVWTDGVSANNTLTSPLVVWSASGGARRVADNAFVFTFSVAASDDGRQIVFSTVDDANNVTGSVVSARSDLSGRKTLLSGIPMGFGTIPCAPRTGFASTPGREGLPTAPIAIYCDPNATTATLSVFPGGQKRQLASGLGVPTLLTSNRHGTRFWTRNAQRQGLMVSTLGEVKLADPGVVAIGYWANDFTVVYAGLTPNGPEIRRSIWGRPPVTLRNQLASFTAFTFGIKDSAVSPDGSKLPFTAGFDPSTGISDQHLLRIFGEPDNDIVVEANQQTLLCSLGNPFTANSRHFLFAQNVDPNNFTTPIAARDRHGVHILSDRLGWSCAAAHSSFALFNDNADLASGSADLKVVDLAARPLKPRLVWQGASLNFSVTPNGRVAAFTTGGPSHQGPEGLYALLVH